MSTAMRRLWVLAVVGLGACKADKPAPKPAPASEAAPAPPPARIALFVDDVAVGSLADTQIGQWPRLDIVLPPDARRMGTWRSIDLVTTTTPTKIPQPSAAYPEAVPAIFPGARGMPAFGMFDPVELAKHGAAALAVQGVTEIRITRAAGSGRGENEHGDGGGANPSTLVLRFKTAHGDTQLDGTELLALPREPQPGSDGQGGKGWKLSALLAKVGVTKYRSVVLLDDKGTALTLEKKDLDDRTAIPFVKLNRQGTLRFRVFKKQGEGWQTGSDLRGLVSIDVRE